MFSYQLFLASVFLFKIPSVYLFIQNDFFTSQAIARILVIVSLLMEMYTVFKHKKQLIPFSLSTCLIVLFFIIQSSSIINAINITSFLNIYKDLIIGMCSFLLFYIFRKRAKSIIKAIILGVIFSVAFQLIIVFAEPIFSQFKFLIYYKYLTLLEANLARNRVYTLSFDEAFIPLFFVFYSYKSYLSSLFILFIAIVSGWRIRVLMAICALITSFFVRAKVGYVLLILLVGFISYSSYNLIFNQQNVITFYQRIDFQDNEAISSITSRTNQIQFAFQNSTLLGFGLGSFGDYSLKNHQPIKSSQTILDDGVSENIHNVLANYLFEAGILGFIVFIGITGMFIKNDYEIIRGKDIIKKAFVLSFWGLYLYGLFNPIYVGTYQFFFWGIRGLLI